MESAATDDSIFKVEANAAGSDQPSDVLFQLGDVRRIATFEIECDRHGNTSDYPFEIGEYQFEWSLLTVVKSIRRGNGPTARRIRLRPRLLNHPRTPRIPDIEQDQRRALDMKTLENFGFFFLRCHVGSVRSLSESLTSYPPATARWF